MHLISAYSPDSFLRPCLVVSTMFTSKTRETALVFVEALNVWHALSFAGDHAPRSSGFILHKQHDTEEEAIRHHLALVRNFCNGGSQEEWERGWPDYCALYEAFCPDAMKEKAIR